MNHLIQSNQNCFGVNSLDRLANSRVSKQLYTDRMMHARALFMPVWKGKHLFADRSGHQSVFFDLETLSALTPGLSEQPILLGRKDGCFYFTVTLPPNDPKIPILFSHHGEFQSLRIVGDLTTHPYGDLLVYAKGITYWHLNHLFCGKCGKPTVAKESGHMRQCTNNACKHQHFPRTDPAIIVLVTHGERCLLARQSAWKPGRFAPIAGFVEPGESLEHAVIREALEETGINIEIETVTYHSSQPWPFPGSIMIGFIATALSDTIEIDGQEIEEAQWFSRNDLLHHLSKETLYLPPKISISFNLIAHWFNQGDYPNLAEMVHSGKGW